MEWLILLLLVPAVVVPIVLQFGFAGCSYTPPRAPAVPAFVAVTPLDGHTVELTWNDTHGAGVTFELERTKGVETVSIAVTSTPLPDEPYRFVDDAQLEAGATYTYRVKTIIPAEGEVSPFSEPATVETWFRAFVSGIAQAGVNESVPGQCIVQRLSPGSLSRGGNLIAVTVRGASDAKLVLSRATVSRPALVGDDFDSAEPPVDLTTSQVTVDGGLTNPLTPAGINIDVDEALLIACDVAADGNARVIRNAPHTAYIKTPPPGGQVTEAGTQNRAGFVERPSELWFIDAIDVATKWPPIP